ncbi:MAG: ribonuclease III [Thermodesulfobacteriota bacterium]|nr:ribonuclease III [Thermodesulfobacteriota bacterium]
MVFNGRQFIDLHIHSTASDGTLAPLEIVALAEKTALAAISITDHDTIDGCRDLLVSGQTLPVRFLTGVEMSTAFPPESGFSGSLHILGYDIDINHPALNRALTDLQNARNQRTPKIISRLNELGINISMADITPSSNGQAGRPHIAAAMKKKGIVPSIDAAFDRYLGKNGPAYVEKERIACADAIALITNAGGVPVLAHPGLLEHEDDTSFYEFFQELLQMGIGGIEAFYPGHSTDQTSKYIGLAQQHDLLITGGTDFHGDLIPDIKLGTGRGDFSVDVNIYERLIAFTRKTGNSRLSEGKMPPAELENILGYTFSNIGLLQQALRHSSYVNEHLDIDMKDNERLEFLGDAALSLCMGHLLMSRFPDLSEGALSQARANLVSTAWLREVAAGLNLGLYLELGKGEEQTNGREKDSILAGAYEALLGAIYLDGGYGAVFKIVERHFSSDITSTVLPEINQDFKSMLQELTQATYRISPTYRITDETGPDHDKTFRCRVHAGEIECEGIGKSKKSAQQMAAQNALAEFKKASRS